MNEYVKSWRFVEHLSKWKLCILLVPVRSLVNIICPLNVAVLTSKMGNMCGSSVMCFYGKGLRINNYTYLMLISRSIKFQSELSGGGIIWPHMQCSRQYCRRSNTENRRLGDKPTRLIQISSGKPDTFTFLAKIKKRSLRMTLLQCFNSGIRKVRPHS